MKKQDGRSRKARISKWIKEERDFGKKLRIDPEITNTNIRMRLKGFHNIAGLDKKGVDHMKYKNSVKLKIIKRRNRDYYSVWRKK